MTMTLRSYDRDISDFRVFYQLLLDRRMDKALGKMAYQLNTSKAALIREGTKELMHQKGVEVDPEWL